MIPLTREALREFFHYSPDNGQFVRRVAIANCSRVGEIAGSLHNGYIKIKIKQTAYFAHRLAWFYVYGCWPLHEIDHINGDHSDNRIANLRDVTHQTNVQNLRSHTSSSSTQRLGVGPHGNRWRARITLNGNLRTLGCYATQDEAQAAYLHAKRLLHSGCTI